jgi:ADP-dependent NAD(P)H-hydrate dehydratase / NAD(P)H-hydrate epimerase
MLSNLRIPTTAQTRSLEAAYIEMASSKESNWSQVLMEIAGRGAANALLSLWDSNPGYVAVFCGPGNNGGDGLVVARYLNLWGVPVGVYLIKETETYKQKASPETRHNLDLLQKLAIPYFSLEELTEEADLAEILEQITSRSSIIVDAIFGTGLKRPVEGTYKVVIDAINESARQVLSIDLPSGVDSDNGQILGAAIRADKTATFGTLKPGHLLYPARELAGEINMVDIGLPDFSNLPKSIDIDESPRVFLSTCGAVQSLLPLRPDNSNKGSFGTILTVGGSMGMMGAAVMASRSALRAGAGLAMLASARSQIEILNAPEIVARPLDQTRDHTIARDAIKQTVQLMAKAKAVILGPGISDNEDTVSFVLDLIDLMDKPCVIDADGLNALAKNPSVLTDVARPEHEGDTRFVLTPHPKELSRLLDMPIKDILADRLFVALSAAARFKAVVVLKGASTVVASPDGQAYINPTGSSSLATAGTGDILSGIIGGLLAQGLRPLDAACAGVYLHGRMGELTQAQIGPSGSIATDFIDRIPQAFSSIQQGELSDIEEKLATSLLSL